MKKISTFASAAILGMFLATGLASAAVRGASSTGTLPGIRNGGESGTSRMRIIAGTVVSTASSSLVLSANQGDYTVNVSPNTRLVNRTWHKIILGNLQAGDKVRVFGRVKGFNVGAKVVRDISIPAHAATTATSTATSTNR